MSWNGELLILINVCQRALNRHCKIPGLADAKALKMMLCGWCLLLVVVGWIIKAVVSQWGFTAFIRFAGLSLNLPVLAWTPLRGCLPYPEDLDHYAKQWKEKRYINDRRERYVKLKPHWWATHGIEMIEPILPSSWQYKCLKNESNKNRAIHLRMFAGFCFNNNLHHQNFCNCIDSFLLPNSRNEEMMGDGFIFPWRVDRELRERFVAVTVNVCWTSSVISDITVQERQKTGHFHLKSVHC